MSSVIIGAAIGAVVGGGSALIGIKKGNRSQIKAFKKQMQYLQMNYNYNQAALDRQERSMYDSAMVELFNLSVNAHQNNAQIEAALAETGTEGRSSKKIEQTVHGQTARQETAIKEDYTQQVWDVRGKKDALYISTKAEVDQSKDALRSNLVGGFPAFMQVLSSAAQGAAIGAVTAGAGSALGSAFNAGANTALNAGANTALNAGANTALNAATNTAANTAVNTATNTAVNTATNTAVNTTAGAMAVDAISSAAPTVTQTVSTGAKAGGSFIARFNTAYAQHKPWIDFFDKIGKIGSYYDSNFKRGGYYY